MKRTFLFLLLLLALPVHASDWSVDVYGLSYHPDNRNLNEDNIGWGLRYNVTDRWFLDAGRYTDSLDGTTTYAGGGYIAPIYGPFGASLGVIYMDQSAARIGNLVRKKQNLWAPIAMLAVKTGSVTTNLGYVPANQEMHLFETVFLFWTLRID